MGGSLFKNEEDYPLGLIILATIYYTGDTAKKDKMIQNMMYNECVEYLMYHMPNTNDIQYFDYDLKFDKFGDKIEIKPKNILSALWFINIFPENTKKVLKEKKYVTFEGTYTFNDRTKKLIIK